MSHRPEDLYEYVATQDINFGGVRAFNEGDPVPASTVDEMGFVDAGIVVLRSEYKPRDDDESPKTAQKRGEMPPHLQSPPTEAGKTDEPTGKATADEPTGKTTKTSKSTKTGS